MNVNIELTPPDFEKFTIQPYCWFPYQNSYQPHKEDDRLIDEISDQQIHHFF